MDTELEKLPKAGEVVKIKGREELGTGEILRVSEVYGIYQADIVFEDSNGRRLESFPVERLESAPDIWKRIEDNDLDNQTDFLLKQLALQIPLQNSGGQLSNSRTHLLPHQILLTRDVVLSKDRRLLIADEVGLGKTIETGMILKELVTRGEGARILIITPAGLTKNWQQELSDSFRLNFEIFGIDFSENGRLTWETHNKVIASIDMLKRPQRLEQLLNSPKWNIIVFDEAHHLSRIRYGSKLQTTQNYKLAENLRSHTRDFLFLSATPHQGNRFQFWSLLQLLNDSLFESEKSIAEHKGLLNRVMVRRTKREVTDKNGKPIFMKREVTTELFQQTTPEQMFYEALTDYLSEGYSAAGIGKAKTTNEQRAIGFVMTTFQKIMSSSLRAIKQALRRRLLVLLLRHQMSVEEQRRINPDRIELAEKFMKLKDKMREVASEILGLTNISSRVSEIDAYILQTQSRVSKKFSKIEETEWSLDSDETGDEGLIVTADIPDEAEKVRRLLKLIPDSVDRKFNTLTRAIDQIREKNPKEKFIIFTQYIETLNFIKEQLEVTYGKGKIAVIKGGPLDEKIEAQEKFWDDDGAQFLISTSAGGEGINLQKGRILFNYDLPWNPMAVEQRIGRIHRYGQQETVQVYNLIAEGTVEEKIYSLLERKLREIAAQIGKIDPVTNEPMEDFRSEILGFLGSSPNYLELYKKAILDKNYTRTEEEIKEAIKQAREASEALSGLTQDLRSFDLQEYLNIEGKFSMEDLEKFTKTAILRLGGSILLNGELYTVETPNVLMNFPGVNPKYKAATFDRDIALRKKSSELFGLGHPFVDAIIDYVQDSKFHGNVSRFKLSEYENEPCVVISVLISIDLENGNRHNEMKLIRVNKSGDVQTLPDNWIMNRLNAEHVSNENYSPDDAFNWKIIKGNYETAIKAIVSQTKLTLEKPLSSRVKLIGISVLE